MFLRTYLDHILNNVPCIKLEGTGLICIKTKCRDRGLELTAQ